ncbi:kinase-like protein [Gigaspora margarita]|uniref:Kinase-like protein n=1 Tax=Gigaspora margarita TaxID=4874 RepID=A0A8H4APK3_GIGMA|nr:kinase-like protein [Gigaspora margarita]
MANEGWLEKAISDKFINYHEYHEFTNRVEIGSGGFATRIFIIKDENFFPDQFVITRHSKNILIHQEQPKIADFGLSKQINEKSTSISIASNSGFNGMIAYIEPQCFLIPNYKRDKRSDIYSFGIILWEISSGKSPYQSIPNLSLPVQICNGLREDPIEGTPSQYIELYEKCWDSDPTVRSEAKLILTTLNRLLNETSNQHIPKETLNKQPPNENSSHHITNETSASSFIPDEASTSNNNIPNETFYEASASNSYITNDKSNDVSISNNIANETSLDVSTTNNHFFLSEPFNKISTSNNRIPNETINQHIINKTSTQNIPNKTSNQHTTNETSNQHIHSETSGQHALNNNETSNHHILNETSNKIPNETSNQYFPNENSKNIETPDHSINNNNTLLNKRKKALEFFTKGKYIESSKIYKEILEDNQHNNEDIQNASIWNISIHLDDKKLNLQNNQLGPEGGKALANALCKNTTLKFLNLGNNGLGTEGGKALVNALNKNTTLTLLDLENNGLGLEEQTFKSQSKTTTLTLLL